MEHSFIIIIMLILLILSLILYYAEGAEMEDAAA